MQSGMKELILPTFYEQLLHAQIPKVQKGTDDLTVFLHFWDLIAQKLLVKDWLNGPREARHEPTTIRVTLYKPLPPSTNLSLAFKF